MPKEKVCIWIEGLPCSPRNREGTTHVDLAVGTLSPRGTTKGGMEVALVQQPWFCFAEMKWHSDISLFVKHDIHRNQLARIIENALLMKGAAQRAKELFVTLVTPAAFDPDCPKSRLYQYKYEEYRRSSETLSADLSRCSLSLRGKATPLEIERLCLQWRSYDELLGSIPSSPLAPAVKQFWSEFGGYQGGMLAECTL